MKSIAKITGSIQKKIMLITIAGILFVCLMIGLLSYYIFKSFFHDEMQNTTQTSLKNLCVSIDNNLENVYRLSRYCTGSSDITAYVQTNPDSSSLLSVATYNRLYEEYNINEGSKYIPRICVISEDNYLQACSAPYSTAVNIAEIVPTLDFYDKLLNASDYDFSPGIIFDPFINRSNRQVIPIIRPITTKYNSEYSGVLFMEFSVDLFLSQMNHYYMEEGSILYLSMEDHLYKYESKSLVEEDSITLSDLKTTDSVIVPLRMNNCYLIQTFSESAILNTKRDFLVLIAAVFISVMTIGIILSIAFNRYMMKPLAKLRSRIELTSLGNFTVDPEIEWDHELGEIGRGINVLSKSIDHLLTKRIEDEKQKSELEYKMLQSQINPHFLYNTLNSIKIMATIQGATGIAEMTTALASLLRSISKGTSLLIPIEEEIKLIKDYFTIQNYRYGGMLSMNINVTDESILKCNILKFTLQPIVENSIFHGIEPKGGTGTITVTLYKKENDDICIDIKDNGIGITPEQIEQILSGKSNTKAEFFKDIGISNVNKRLQYEFGDEYGITIESEYGSYTIMRVTIPSVNSKQEK